jgi:putative transcriptional regulator
MKRRTTKRPSIFNDLMQGLRETLAHTRGELTLRTTTLPLAPPQAGREDVVRIRRKLGMSQALFAACLNVSKKTVQSWEQGTRFPAAGELRLLQIIAHEPGRFEKFVLPRSATARRKPRRAA